MVGPGKDVYPVQRYVLHWELYPPTGPAPNLTCNSLGPMSRPPRPAPPPIPIHSLIILGTHVSPLVIANGSRLRKRERSRKSRTITGGKKRAGCNVQDDAPHRRTRGRGRGALAAQVARHVRRVHRQERGAGLPDRECPPEPNLHHPWCVLASLTPHGPPGGPFLQAPEKLTAIAGRFRDAEIASETLHSSVQLLSLYHDALLARLLPPRSPTPHARYTRHWASRSPLYRRVALVLQMVRYTELLLEMAAKRRGGERLRWRAVVLVEVVKAFCRLVLLSVTRGRSTLSPVLPEREAPPPEEAEEDPTLGGLIPEAEAQREGKKAHEKEWKMPRTGMEFPALPSSGDITGYLLSRVLTPDDVKPAPRLLNRLSGAGHAAEVLYILAPLIYATSLAMAGPDRRKSWTPWMVGLGAELVARQLRERGLRTTALERDEWRRRGWGLGWWAMRGPFYEGVVKGVVEGVRGRVPGVLGGILEDYEYLWENYYFSTSD